jgi:hypothetical protein
MKRFAPYLLLASSALTGIAGCAGVDTGNGGPALVRMALTVGPNTAAPDADGATLTITAASAVVERLDLHLPDALPCASIPTSLSGTWDPRVTCDGDRLRVAGPFTIDLLTGAATPALPAIAVVEGVYRRVDVRFAEDDDVIALRASGTMPVAGVTRNWSMAVGFDEELRFDSNGVGVTADVVTRLLLALDVTGWFNALPIAACAAAGALPEEAGTFILGDGDDDCIDIEEALENAVGGSGRLEHEDEEDDERED